MIQSAQLFGHYLYPAIRFRLDSDILWKMRRHNITDEINSEIGNCSIHVLSPCNHR